MGTEIAYGLDDFELSVLRVRSRDAGVIESASAVDDIDEVACLMAEDSGAVLRLLLREKEKRRFRCNTREIRDFGSIENVHKPDVLTKEALEGRAPECGIRDSNPHGLLHQILSLTRLPITPMPPVTESGCKGRYFL